jgi:hypothetical protein
MARAKRYRNIRRLETKALSAFFSVMGVRWRWLEERQSKPDMLWAHLSQGMRGKWNAG